MGATDFGSGTERLGWTIGSPMIPELADNLLLRFVIAPDVFWYGLGICPSCHLSSFVGFNVSNVAFVPVTANVPVSVGVGILGPLGPIEVG